MREVGGTRGVIERYRRLLSLDDDMPVVSLGEGSTPLLLSGSLSERLNAEVWLKLEGLNPTGSFKDRGMTVAVSTAAARGAEVVVCASTGNTSASAAAYAGRAGLPCVVVVPSGGVARGKLAQAVAHGARVLEIEGTFDEALGALRALDEDPRLALVNSVNPDRIEGQKTAAFEIVEELGRAPDLHLMPVGNAGNITSYWRGYRQARENGMCARLPRMFGVQAEGAAPLVTGQVVARPETVASAIRIGNPASWNGALEAAEGSGGGIAAVSDDEILEGYRLLAAEGVFVEPASAAGVAGLLRMARDDRVPAGAQVVCVLTGHGLKDPDVALATGAAPVRLRGTNRALRDALGL